MTIIKTDVEFGSVYRDKVTGFEGIAVAITKWQYGCIRISLRAKMGVDGKISDAECFDEASLEEIKTYETVTGGPTPAIKNYPNVKY